MSKVCLLVLVGLPGSGKTTFAKLFKSFLKRREESADEKFASSYTMAHIVYDDILPAEIASDTASQLETSEWKLHRRSIVQCLDKLLSNFSERAIQPHTTKSSLHDDSDAEFWYQNSSPVQVDGLLQETGSSQQVCASSSQHLTPQVSAESEQKAAEKSNAISDHVDILFTAMVGNEVTARSDFANQNRRHVVVLDDNMYYSSMRYEIYQLARKYCVGFVQLYFPGELACVLQRNSMRPCPVTEDVIRSMASRFDVPRPTENVWERRTHHWTNDDYSSRNFDKVLQLIDEAVENPVQSLGLVSDKGELKAIAKKVNSVRQLILDGMRNHRLLVPSAIVADMPTNALEISDDNIDCKPSSEPLYRFIRDLFSHELSLQDK